MEDYDLRDSMLRLMHYIKDWEQTIVYILLYSREDKKSWPSCFHQSQDFAFGLAKYTYVYKASTREKKGDKITKKPHKQIITQEVWAH